MNDPEDFLTRWSRRKRATADEHKKPAQDPQAPRASDAPRTDEPTDAAASQPDTARPETTEAIFDLSKLPPIESITAETDIRPFLAAGVPADLRLAALRRAWAVDPKVRDFVGLNDYDFDFHTPGAIPGFGSLEMTDALRREVAQMFSSLQGEPAQRRTTIAAAAHPEPQATAPASEIDEHRDAAGSAPVETAGDASEHPEPVQDEVISGQATAQPDRVPAALQQEHSQREDLQTLARRGHGRALPK